MAIPRNPINPTNQAATEREKLLEEAIRITTVSRNLEYGVPENSFQLIANYWNVYLNSKYGITLSATDVPLMMVLMKMARLTTNPQHRDSAVDVAGYMGCLAELN